MVENLPASAGNTGLIPGLGGSHMPVHQNCEPACLEPALCKREASGMRRLCLTEKSGPHLPQLGKSPCAAMKTQCSQNSNKRIFLKMYQVTRRKINQNKRLRNCENDGVMNMGWEDYTQKILKLKDNGMTIECLPKVNENFYPTAT